MNTKILELVDDELDAVTGGCGGRYTGYGYCDGPSAADQALLGVVAQMKCDTVNVLMDAGIVKP